MGNGWGNGARAARFLGGGTVTTVSVGLPKNNAEGGLFLWPKANADMPRQVAHKKKGAAGNVAMP